MNMSFYFVNENGINYYFDLSYRPDSNLILDYIE